MSNTEGDNCISVNIQNYVEDKITSVKDSINNKCELLQISLNGLRSEWTIEHRNLIQRYETSENAKALAKIEVDKHFETINGLQTRMDKLTENFVTKEDFTKTIDDRMKVVWATVASISFILFAAFIAHIAGRL